MFLRLSGLQLCGSFLYREQTKRRKLPEIWIYAPGKQYRPNSGFFGRSKRVYTKEFVFAITLLCRNLFRVYHSGVAMFVSANVGQRCRTAILNTLPSHRIPSTGPIITRNDKHPLLNTPTTSIFPANPTD